MLAVADRRVRVDRKNVAERFDRSGDRELRVRCITKHQAHGMWLAVPLSRRFQGVVVDVQREVGMVNRVPVAPQRDERGDDDGNEQQLRERAHITRWCQTLQWVPRVPRVPKVPKVTLEARRSRAIYDLPRSEASRQ